MRPTFFPTCWYHRDYPYPTGKTFFSAAEFAVVDDGRWVDDPRLLKEQTEEKPEEKPEEEIPEGRTDPFESMTRKQIIDNYGLGDSREVKRMKREDLIALAKLKESEQEQ